MDEPIFIIGSDGKLASVQKNTYDREAELQQLINDHPELIPGMGDIGEGGSLRWLLVQREAGIPREDGGSDWWSIDHILVDQFATPTFVEVKRASDTRVRREVVAQMLDYVANATLYWQPGTLEGWFNSQDEEPDRRLLEFLDDAELSPENFWSRVDENLRSGRVRCVFVADSIPDSLIRLVEFLNEHLRLTEVYAVELPQYVSADQLPGVRVIVPKLIGNTTRAIANKSEQPSAPKRQWDEESFFADLGERSDLACVTLCREILEWTRVQGVRVVYGNGKRDGPRNPSVDLTQYPTRSPSALKTSYNASTTITSKVTRISRDVQFQFKQGERLKIASEEHDYCLTAQEHSPCSPRTSSVSSLTNRSHDYIQEPSNSRK